MAAVRDFITSEQHTAATLRSITGNSCGGGCLAEHWGWAGTTTPAPLAVDDTVQMTVAGIGTITNHVVAGPEFHPVPAARRFLWSEPPAPRRA